MKNIYLIIGFCLCWFSSFSQFQPLETLDEVMIGPANVDVHYLEQVEFYVGKYENMLTYLEEVELKHQSELEKQLSKKKSKIWRKNQIKKEENIIAQIQTDIEVIGDYIFLWKNSKIGAAREKFELEFDANLCYEISSMDKIYFPSEYKVEKEDRDFLEWNEIIPSKHVKEGDVKKLAKQAGYKWVKKRADKNCLSKDPNDCMVWSLVEIPWEFQTERYDDGITPNFKLSDDKQFLIRTFEIESRETKKYILLDILDDTEIEVKDFKKLSCN